MLPNECYEVLLDKGPRSPDLGGWHKASLGALTERGLVHAQQRQAAQRIQHAAVTAPGQARAHQLQHQVFIG